MLIECGGVYVGVESSICTKEAVSSLRWRCSKCALGMYLHDMLDGTGDVFICCDYESSLYLMS